ncbi:MAG TPA: Nudix family hydrolase [Verrucomicrobiae bacterium]|nr:Nudix family hydrolase [Verrucomicrobiae bacterium]
MHIAVGVLRNAAGEVLACQRPAHKLYPGEWEFPGGKVEPGEDVLTALRRELREELGIKVREARPLICLRHTYPELAVELDTWLVGAWEGHPESTEHPAVAWVTPVALSNWPLLVADKPIVNALRLPPQLVVTPPDFEPSLACATVPDALVRLRLPRASDAQYHAIARMLGESGMPLLLDRDPHAVEQLGAAGFHATSGVLAILERRPVSLQSWFGASCHSAEELTRARALGADYAVLGPVLPTATHPGVATLGWEGFGHLARNAGLPVYAIGGLAPNLLDLAWRHGAQGIAGISAYWG